MINLLLLKEEDPSTPPAPFHWFRNQLSVKISSCFTGIASWINSLKIQVSFRAVTAWNGCGIVLQGLGQLVRVSEGSWPAPKPCFP